MTISLQLLFAEINQIKDEQDWRSHLAPKIGEYFAAKRSAIFFFNRLETSPRLLKVLKIALSVEQNPLVRYLVERHTPVHEGIVTSPQAWAIICPRPDHWHVMAGPIVSHGQLVGVIGCTREKSMPAFDTQNLADLSAICLHLSVWITARSLSVFDEKTPRQPLKPCQLTSRELQIAKLVALGRTNAEIGKEIWITENSVKQALKRMFRKLEVSSRAEMVAELYATQQYLPSIKLSPSNKYKYL
jgi:DNA-binding CsgD family transcriptional regulator